MRIGIIADSHDHLANLERAIDKLLEHGVDALLHAGDFVAPFAVKRLQRLNVPIWAVKGNNDGEIAGLRHAFSFLRASYSERDLHFELGGKRICLQHIPNRWNEILRDDPPQVLVFGHTHQRYLRRPGEEISSPNSMQVDVPASCPTLIINPGELCGWLSSQAGFAILDLDTLEVEFCDL